MHRQHTSNSSTNLEDQRYVKLDEEQLAIQRSQEYFALALEIQKELTRLHQRLGEAFHIEIEERTHRLCIERDEALVGWGKSILGLSIYGVEVKLQTSHGQLTPALSEDHTSKLNADGDIESSKERVLGDPLWKTPEWRGGGQLNSTSSTNQHPHNTSSSAHTDQQSYLTHQAPNHRVQMVSNDQKVSDQSKTEGVLEVNTSRPVTSSPQTHPKVSSERSASSRSASSQSMKLYSNFDSIEIDDDEKDLGVADVEPISLTQFSLAELRSKMSQPKGWQSNHLDHLYVEESKNDEWKVLAKEITQRLGAPRNDNLAKIKQHLIELETEVECCQQWSVFDRETQNAILTLITSRLRKIQDFIGEDPFDQDRIAKMFRRLTRFSSDFRPGFIHGLSRDKVPEFESWEIDEQEAWKRLEDQLELKPPAPRLTPEAEQLIQRLKETIQRGESETDFSNKIRNAVGDCLNAGLSHDNEYLAHLIKPYLSHLSGKRFKKFRLAISDR